MTINVGTIDRLIRAIVGAVLLYLAFFSGMPLFADALFKYGAALIGVVMLVTSTLKMCPLYTLIGVKTCRSC